MIGYPSGQDGAILPARDYLPCPAEKFPKSHIINPLLTKLVRSRWLDIGLVLVFACLWTLTPSRSINSQKKKRTWPISSHLDLTLQSITHTSYSGYWTGTSLQQRPVPRNIIKKRLMLFAFEKTPHISLGCKLVPVQYREYNYGPLNYNKCDLPEFSRVQVIG